MRGLLFTVALIGAVFLAYQPAWHAGFIWDDDLHLLDNPVLKPGGLARAWVPGSYISYWPVTFTVFRVEYSLWQLDPVGFHLVNIALHALAAILVWRVLAELELPGAMAAAAIFALHPVNVETVAWVSQLKGILALVFALISTLAYLKFDRRGGTKHYALALLAFCLSVLSKGMVITLPIVLLACAWWRRGSIRHDAIAVGQVGDLSGHIPAGVGQVADLSAGVGQVADLSGQVSDLSHRDLLRMIPFVAIGAAAAVIEIWTQAGSTFTRNDGLLSRTAIAGRAVWFYLGELLWPFDLRFVYRRWPLDRLNALSFLPLLLLLMLFASALRGRRTWGRSSIVAIVCYVALLLPALGFVNIGYMRYSLVADHWQYAAAIVPCAALSALAAGWACRIRVRKAVAAVAALALLAGLGWLTHEQTRVYADAVTIWRATLAKDPDCPLAHSNLGNLLARERRFDEAISEYRQALKAEPNFPEVRNNLGSALDSSGHGIGDEALEQFRIAVQLDPNFASAQRNLADALASRHDFAGAIEHYRQALKQTPDDVDVHDNLATALLRSGQLDDAIYHYRKAVKLDPDFEQAQFHLGNALFGRREPDQAIYHYQKALKLRPAFTDARFQLANALAATGQIDDAIDQYRILLQSMPNHLTAHWNLAIALTSRQRTDEALEHYRQALTLAEEDQNEALAKRIREQMKKTAPASGK